MVHRYMFSNRDTSDVLIIYYRKIVNHFDAACTRTLRRQSLSPSPNPFCDVIFRVCIKKKLYSIVSSSSGALL